MIDDIAITIMAVDSLTEPNSRDYQRIHDALLEDDLLLIGQIIKEITERGVK